ncbi:Abscisic acid 8'-hydroxylase 1 [Hibiscus syriacus]|uniref:Abscisic acid 8'-hydroxylase 1 n=1 Tax=Hibiscus syriacus TaxID=106335 RepID=A0A6A3CIS6_HIBSY|nr:Abscisic acid 8'-hydroxylase 1 [Hibiscus syriacus]
MAFEFVPPLFVSLVLVFLFCCLLKFFKSNNRHNLPLPPGTMGWPYIGETFQLYSQDPNVFFASKQKRFGSVFKTHILGCPCVMISSPKAAKFVLVTKAHMFKPTFPASKERMLGKQAIFFSQGQYHSQLRKLVLRAFMPEAIKTIVSNIESVAKDSLHTLEGRMKSYTEKTSRDATTLEKGYNSMPINVPGTLFNKSMKARKELAEILAKIISTRRRTKQDYNDLLGSFMGDKQGLTDEQIADNIIGVIFAAVTPPPAYSRKEKCGDNERGLSWADTKAMPITSRVIQETLRVASILSFTFREAVEDVEYEGYLIPKGWKVYHFLETFITAQKSSGS